MPETDENEKKLIAEKVLRDFNARDRFTALCGIRLTVVRDGYAETEMSITDSLMNGMNRVQGGATFTLADFAFAGACCGGGRNCVAMESTIHFLRPGLGKKLTARAERVSSGRTTCLCEISVTNDEGKLVAKVTTLGYYVS